MPNGIIRHRGEVQNATTPLGHRVQRQEKLFVPEYRNFVTCAPYDDHFVYENPAVNESAYMCTCGAVAVIAPPNTRGMLVCYFHALYGRHQTSFVNKDEFSAVAGAGEIVRAKGKKELI